MQSSVSSDVILGPKEMKWFARRELAFASNKKPFSSVKKCTLKKIMFDYNVTCLIMMVINRAKFDVCTPTIFGGVKTHRRTERIALYGIDKSMLQHKPYANCSGFSVGTLLKI